VKFFHGRGKSGAHERKEPAEQAVTPGREYELPPLPYQPGDLEPHYSRELLELHHGKHHATYVKGANQTLADLAEARRKNDFHSINQLQKNLAFNISGHVLHSLLWRNMAPDAGGVPNGDLARGLERDFGGFDAFKEQMMHAALNIQGSGWAALSWEPIGGRLVVEQIYDHQGNTGNGTVPVMVLDMWEHAYYLQYRNEKKKWASAFWHLANWPDVQKRFESVQALNLKL
jgi:Fe-Mn family superoxide dismutase